MKPKYTDLDRYRNGYVPSGKTDVRKTFNRIRAEKAAIQEEVKVKVSPMKKAKIA